MLKIKTVLLTTLLLTGTMVSVSESALSRPSRALFNVDHQAEKASRHIYEAQFRLSILRNLDGVDRELIALGDRLLSSAQSLQQGGQFFKSAETAKAAERIYEAVGNLYEARTGRPAGITRGGISKSYYDAPYRVSEELARTEAELNYYRATDNTVRDLLGRARQIAQPIGITAPVPGDFAILARNRSAIQMLKAARHLMRAERGF